MLRLHVRPSRSLAAIAAAILLWPGSTVMGQERAEVRIDEEGVVCWPTGADLAPDRMYERLRSQASAAR